MEEIWNRIIQGQSGVRYRQSEFFSPYCESVVGSIRKQQDGTDCITMNTFYRYDDIFIFRVPDPLSQLFTDRKHLETFL